MRQRKEMNVIAVRSACIAFLYLSVARPAGGVEPPNPSAHSSRGRVTPELVTSIGAKFQTNCMHCHRPPDLRFRTDRAWLDQIHRTA
jgi:hypothetical protein